MMQELCNISGRIGCVGKSENDYFGYTSVDSSSALDGYHVKDYGYYSQWRPVLEIVQAARKFWTGFNGTQEYEVEI